MSRGTAEHALAIWPGPARPGRFSAARRRAADLRRRWVLVAVSLLLHLLLLAAVLWLPPGRHLPPPAPAMPVQMVFNNAASTPLQMPGPAPKPQAGRAAALNPVRQPRPVPVPPVPPPVPPAPVQPPAPAQPPPPAPQVHAAQTSPAPVPPPKARTPEAVAVPTRVAPAPRVAPAHRPAPRVAPVPRPVRRVPPRAFPRPMFNSAGNLLSGAPQGEKQVRVNGGAQLQPFAQVAGAPLGTPWFAAFRLWVEEHKYYPTQAAEMGQQGTATVRVVVAPDGQVRTVTLTEGSGSPFLDLALQGMFRGAHLPALPLHEAGPVTIQVRMTYILRP